MLGVLLNLNLKLQFMLKRVSPSLKFSMHYIFLLLTLLGAGYSVRTPQYRYTEWVDLQDPELDTQEPDWGTYMDWGELYDLGEDPNETNNLYRLDQWHDTKKMLRKILHRGWHEHN